MPLPIDAGLWRGTSVPRFTLGTDLKFGPRLFGLTGGRLLLIFPIGLTLGRGRYRLDKFGGPALFALSLKLQWNGDAHQQLLAFSFG
jgi:hypothetical protein